VGNASPVKVVKKSLKRLKLRSGRSLNLILLKGDGNKPGLLPIATA